MKLTSISVGDTHPRDTRTLDQFRESDQAKSPLGMLLIALAEETVWSNTFSVYGSFGHENPFVQVSHQLLTSEWSLMIYLHDLPLTVRDMEDKVRDRLRQVSRALHSGMELLQERISRLNETREGILLEKAKAAIVAKFPEAANAQYFRTDGSMYSFSSGGVYGIVYVTREIRGDFVGGVVKPDVNSTEWFSLQDGTRRGMFFGCLARQYAAKHLEIEEDSIIDVQLLEETEFPHRVARVILRRSGLPETNIITVEFGPDEMPENVV